MTKTAPQKGRKHAVILNIKIDSSSASSLLAQISDWVERKKKFYVVTPNPEIVIAAQSDPVLASILNSADMSLPDGIGLVWASKLSSKFTPEGSSFASVQSSKLEERISGIDVMEDLIKMAAEKQWRVFLLGGKSGVAATAAKNLTALPAQAGQWPNSLIAFDNGPWLDNEGKSVNKEEKIKEREVLKKINLFKPDLLFVGFGAPKQEKWVASNYNKLQTYGIMVVGGSFDYLAGRVPRAPLWLRNLGLEWLFRLILEPWRIGRQLSLLKFIWAVVTRD
ncbi:WecB/TagA/CpsF family glycosyltransferase [Candidatus Microgenomates bacterium]|nr:WecB/TagA/CpsF family glycosyltransferase [Candidatus Microgenomates bacterium]